MPVVGRDEYGPAWQPTSPIGCRLDLLEGDGVHSSLDVVEVLSEPIRIVYLVVGEHGEGRDARHRNSGCAGDRRSTASIPCPFCMLKKEGMDEWKQKLSR